MQDRRQVRFILILALVSTAALSGCYRFVRPPEIEPVALEDAPIFGSGAVRPRGAGPSAILPVRDHRFRIRSGGIGPRVRYQIDLVEWSYAMAEYLRAEYRRRGVDVSRGPALRVRIESMSFEGQSIGFYKSFWCRISARVKFGKLTKTLDAGAGSPYASRKGSIREAVHRLVTAILNDADIRSQIAKSALADAE